MTQSIVVGRSAQHPREFWIRLVRRWQASQTSQQAIADMAGVSVHTLRYWAAKLRAEGPSDFVEVASVPAERRLVAMECRIRLGERVVIELPALPPVEWLRALTNEG